MKIAFLPGMLCDQRLWQPTLEKLPAHFTCKPVDLLRCDSIAQMKAETQSTIIDCDLVVAFSLGGYVAQELIADNPTGFPATILLGTSGTGLTNQEISLRQQVLKIAQTQNFDPMPNSRARDFVAADCPADIRAIVQTMAREAGADKFIAQLSSTLDRRHTLDALGGYNKPCLVVAAEQDNIVPKTESKKLANAIPNSHFISLKHCGHMIPLEQPKLVAEMIHHFSEKVYA